MWSNARSFFVIASRLLQDFKSDILKYLLVLDFQVIFRMKFSITDFGMLPI